MDHCPKSNQIIELRLAKASGRPYWEGVLHPGSSSTDDDCFRFQVSLSLRLPTAEGAIFIIIITTSYMNLSRVWSKEDKAAALSH